MGTVLTPFTFSDASSMYTPFIERPQVIDNDYYIPLPTVTRKYIDQPADSILDAIESMHFPSSGRREKRQENKISNSALNSKNNNQLKIDTNSERLAVTHHHGYNSNIKENLIPEINSWLSKHNETTIGSSDIMIYNMSNHSNKKLNI
jgi:hypothetical protein